MKSIIGNLYYILEARSEKHNRRHARDQNVSARRKEQRTASGLYEATCIVK